MSVWSYTAYKLWDWNLYWLDIQLILTNLACSPSDYSSDMLFWVDAKLHMISSSDLNGNNRRVVFYSHTYLKHPFAISVFEVCVTMYCDYDDVIKWKHFPRYWRFCAGNSPVTGEFPSQRPVTRSFDVSSHLRLNKRFSKQPWGW